MSKNDSNIDPRVVRTRKLLRNALLDLIPEKGYSAITIQDITDRATLNRATFYLHYRDKLDLLEDAFEVIMADAALMPPDDGSAGLESALVSIEGIFDHIAKHDGFFRVMLGEENVPEFSKRIHAYIESVGVLWFNALQPDEEEILVPPELAVIFLGSAVEGLLVWWLENEMPYPSSYMSMQVMRLTALGLHRSLGIKETQYEELL